MDLAALTSSSISPAPGVAAGTLPLAHKNTTTSMRCARSARLETLTRPMRCHVGDVNEPVSKVFSLS